MKIFFVSLLGVVIIFLSNTSFGELKECQEIGFVKLSGGIVGAEDISAIAKIGKNGSFLVIGSDEACTAKKKKKRKNCPSSEAKLGNYIQLLKVKPGTEDSYEVHKDI